MAGKNRVRIVRGNKGNISGLIGNDKVGTTHNLDVQQFTAVGSNPLRVNTAPGDQGHAHYDGTIKTMAVVVRGRVIHGEPMSMLLLGTTGSAELVMSDGMKITGSMIAHETPLYWERASSKGHIDIVFKAMMNGIYEEKL